MLAFRTKMVVFGIVLILSLSLNTPNGGEAPSARAPGTVAYIVYDPDNLGDCEEMINASVAANHTVDLVDDDDVGSTDLSGYDVILWSGF